MQGKRNYKDSLFRNIFKDKKRLCSLYNVYCTQKCRHIKKKGFSKSELSLR